MSTMEFPCNISVVEPAVDGTYELPFDYARQEDLCVAFEAEDGTVTVLELNIDYTVSPTMMTYGRCQVTLMTEPPDGAVLVIEQGQSRHAADTALEHGPDRLTQVAQDLPPPASFSVSRRSLTVGLAPLLGAVLTRPAAIQALAGAMTAADKTKLDGLENTTASVDPGNFASRAQLSASMVGAATTHTRLAGRTTAGDGGGAAFVRIDADPGIGGVRSQDRYLPDGAEDRTNGGWWELVYTGRHDARQFASINEGLAFVGAKGGGQLRIVVDISFDETLDVPSNVTLIIPYGVTLTLTASVTSAIDLGTDRSRPGLQLEGTLALDGKATYGVYGAGCYRPRIGGWGKITGWKGGVRLESSGSQALTCPMVRGVIFGAPHSSNVIYPFILSCAPHLGYAMVDGCDIDGVVCEDATPGAYSRTNSQTADQVVLQGVIGGRVRNVTSRHGGENGLTIEFGSRDIDVEVSEFAGCDGHGLTVTGANYRIDVADVSGTFQVGETLTGGTSGATADIQFLIGGVIWVDGPSLAKFATGETVTGVTSGATATVSVVHNVRDIRIHDSVRTTGNGLDVASTGATLAGAFIHHCEATYVGGHHTENDDTGVLISESTYGVLPGLHAPTGAKQTKSVTVTGGATPKGPASFEGDGSTTVIQADIGGRVRFGPNLLANPAGAFSASSSNTGVTVNTLGQGEATANAMPAFLLNRTGSPIEKLGPVVDIRKDGTSVAYIGTAGFKFPEFLIATKPAAADHPGAWIVVTDASGGRSLCRSDGTTWNVFAVEGAPVA